MKRLIIVLLVLIIPLGATLAQPDLINTALTDLNTRLGTSYTLNDIDNWSWAENVYDDASLGCPQEGQTYAQIVTIGYVFTFTVEGTVYDYRVGETGSPLFLCSTTTLSPTAVPGAPTPTLAVPTGEAISLASADFVREVGRVEGENQPVLAWSLDNQSIAVAAVPAPERDILGGVLIYNAFNLQAEPLFLQMPAPVTKLAYAEQEGGSLLISGHETGEVLLTPVTPQLTESVALADPTGLLETVSALAVSADERMVAAAGTTTVIIWEIATGQPLATYNTAAAITALAFSPDSLTLAMGDVNGQLTLANPTAGPGMALYPVALTTIHAIAYTPNGERIAVGSNDGLIRMWNPAIQDTTGIYDNATQDAILTLAFSTDGLMLAAAGGNPNAVTRDNSIRLWDFNGFTVVGGLTGHETPVRALAFSPDGLRLASISEDGTLRLWGTADDAVG
jgi:hypothetical protein